LFGDILVRAPFLLFSRLARLLLLFGIIDYILTKQRFWIFRFVCGRSLFPVPVVVVLIVLGLSKLLEEASQVFVVWLAFELEFLNVFEVFYEFVG
jgi:hypothetical protein